MKYPRFIQDYQRFSRILDISSMFIKDLRRFLDNIEDISKILGYLGKILDIYLSFFEDFNDRLIVIFDIYQKFFQDIKDFSTRVGKIGGGDHFI